MYYETCSIRRFQPIPTDSNPITKNSHLQLKLFFQSVAIKPQIVLNLPHLTGSNRLTLKRLESVFGPLGKAVGFAAAKTMMYLMVPESVEQHSKSS